MSIPNHTEGKVCRSNGSTVQIDQLMKMKRKNFSINFYSIYWMVGVPFYCFFHIYRVIKFVFGCKIFKKGVKRIFSVRYAFICFWTSSIFNSVAKLFKAVFSVCLFGYLSQIQSAGYMHENKLHKWISIIFSPSHVNLNVVLPFFHPVCLRVYLLLIHHRLNIQNHVTDTSTASWIAISFVVGNFPFYFK